MVSWHIFIPISTAKLPQAPSKKAGKKVAPAKTGAGGRNKVAKVRFLLSFSTSDGSITLHCRQIGKKGSRRNKSAFPT